MAPLFPDREITEEEIRRHLASDEFSEVKDPGPILMALCRQAIGKARQTDFTPDLTQRRVAWFVVREIAQEIAASTPATTIIMDTPSILELGADESESLGENIESAVAQVIERLLMNAGAVVERFGHDATYGRPTVGIYPASARAFES